MKIAWTLRVDPVDEKSAIFRTETRVMATDTMARTKFRRYWSLLSPGIKLIRRVSLRPVKSEAERRCRALAAAERATTSREALTSVPDPPQRFLK